MYQTKLDKSGCIQNWVQMRTIIDQRAIIWSEQKWKCKERQTLNSFTSSICIYVTLIFYVRGWSLHHPNQNICWILRKWVLFTKIPKRKKVQGQTKTDTEVLEYVLIVLAKVASANMSVRLFLNRVGNAVWQTDMLSLGVYTQRSKGDNSQVLLKWSS